MPDINKAPGSSSRPGFTAVPDNDAGTRTKPVEKEEPANLFDETTTVSANGNLPSLSDMLANLPEKFYTDDGTGRVISGSEVMRWAIETFAEKPQSEMREMFAKYGYQFDKDAWCADFVRMVLFEAIGQQDLPDWYNNVDNKASCGRILAQAQGHEVSLADAQPGDIVLFDWGKDGKVDHVGFFLDVTPDGTQIITLEGNTKLQIPRNPEDFQGDIEGSFCSIKIRDLDGQVYGIYAITERQPDENGFIYGDRENPDNA